MDRLDARARRVAAGSAFVIAGACVWTADGRHSSGQRATEAESDRPLPAISAPATPDRPGPWTRLPNAPLDGGLPRYANSTVWTGERMLVWGGVGDVVGHCPIRQSDGAAYDPDADEWAKMAAAPLSPRVGHTTAWSGEELIVWGGSTSPADDNCRSDLIADGAAYDPKTDEWRELSASPLTPRRHAAGLWTDAGMLVVGGWGDGSSDPDQTPELLADAALYDLAADSWAPLEPPPELRGPVAAAWTGERALVLSAESAAAFLPAERRWLPIAPPPIEVTHWDTVVWTGDQLLVHTAGSVDAFHSYDPSADSWRRLPSPPLVAVDDTPRSGFLGVWTGEAMILWGGERPDDLLFCDDEDCTEPDPGHEGFVYEPAEESWTALPDSPLGRRIDAAGVWTGSALLVFGGVDADVLKEGQNYTPSPELAGTGARLDLVRLPSASPGGP